MFQMRPSPAAGILPSMTRGQMPLHALASGRTSYHLVSRPSTGGVYPRSTPHRTTYPPRRPRPHIRPTTRLRGGAHPHRSAPPLTSPARHRLFAHCRLTTPRLFSHHVDSSHPQHTPSFLSARPRAGLPKPWRPAGVSSRPRGRGGWYRIRLVPRLLVLRFT